MKATNPRIDGRSDVGIYKLQGREYREPREGDGEEEEQLQEREMTCWVQKELNYQSRDKIITVLAHTVYNDYVIRTQ